MDPSTDRVRFDGSRLDVPVRFEVHWRRFHTVPTDLVRDAAYEASLQAAPRMDDADREVFAESFLRDVVLSHD